MKTIFVVGTRDVGLRNENENRQKQNTKTQKTTTREEERGQTEDDGLVWICFGRKVLLEAAEDAKVLPLDGAHDPGVRVRGVDGVRVDDATS